MTVHVDVERGRSAAWTCRAVVAALVVMSQACADVPDQSESISQKPLKQRPDQEVWGWTTAVSRSGRKRARVAAQHFEKSDDSPVAFLDGGVEVEFFSSDGRRPASTLSAGRGRIDAATYDMTILGDVVLIADDGTRLETDSLQWTRDTERITGEGDVIIRRPDGVETGVGFEASSDLKEWSLHRVTTRLGTAGTPPADSLVPGPPPSPLPEP